MLTVLKAASLAAVVSIGLVFGQAQAATVDWGAEGGPNHFVTGSVSFTGFYADTLVGVSQSNANYNTSNGGSFPVTFELDILLDGVWTNIFTDVTTGTSRLHDTISDITFAYGEVTGLRGTATGQDPLYTTPLFNWALVYSTGRLAQVSHRRFSHLKPSTRLRRSPCQQPHGFC